jgi:hypothetical protein
MAISADGRMLSVDVSGLAISLPEGWRAEATESPSVFLVLPEAQLTECEMLLTSGSSFGTSASGYLQLNDLGPRFGSTITQQEQRTMTVAGWDVAYFSWVDAGSVRHREVIMPYGVHLLTISYRELLTSDAIGKQAKPCIWDFDWLLANGINLP